MPAISPELIDVPETMLWTLHNRAVEAQREDRIIHDPQAVNIYKQLHYDFERSFGQAEPSHAVRSLVFDSELTQFLQHNPNGLIINLGEGLETQRYRLARNQAQWFSVDLPDAIDIRERFIQPDEQHQHLRYSATDIRWFDWVPENKPAFITAQGLFMYFPETELRQFLQELAKRFPGSWLMFDAIPHWLSKKTLSEKGWMKTPHYRTPPMPWGINRNDISTTFNHWLPGLNHLEVRYWPQFPRGIAARWIFPLIERLPLLKNLVPTLVLLQFAEHEDVSKSSRPTCDD